MTFFSDINMADWRLKDKVFQPDTQPQNQPQPQSLPSPSFNSPSHDDDLTSSERDINNIFEDPSPSKPWFAPPSSHY